MHEGLTASGGIQPSVYTGLKLNALAEKVVSQPVTHKYLNALFQHHITGTPVDSVFRGSPERGREQEI